MVRQQKNPKKIAFVKHNRPVDTKRVDKYIYIIAQDKYEKAYPIIVAEAEKVLEKNIQLLMLMEIQSINQQQQIIM